MADEQLWFVPVTGGHEHALEHAMRPGITGFDNTNVQWDMAKYPSGVETEAACTSMTSYTALAMGSSGPPVVESKLTDCFGMWRWRSCTDGVNITVGGQLGVGTVFARELRTRNTPPDPPIPYISWSIVDVWAKYRVDNTARLDNIFLSISDRTGNSAACLNDVPNALNNVWKVIYLTNNNWDDWDDPAENLRVTLSLQGTTNINNVGPVTVNVEWFAIRLRNPD